MHPKALLDLTTQLVREVLKLDAPADSLVSLFFRRQKALGVRERHALAETAYAVLRQRLLWANLAQSGQGPMERRLAILAWQGQPHVLKNALSPDELRWLEHAQTIDRSTLPDKLRHNLPDWLANPLKAELGDEGFWALVETFSAGAPLDLRVNEIKTRRDEVIKALAEAGLTAEPTPYSPIGLRMQGKPALQKLPLYTGGHVEVQDEGSQLLALMTGAKRGEMVVDFCAGAGGKTLALGAMMRNTGRLYAFDVSGHRLDNLKPRLARSGLSNVYAAQIAHERDERIKRLSGKIDRVLVDAPCSGLGTLRRNPDLKWRQSPQAVQELREKQLAILRSAVRLLKPGGRLVYATCSLLPAENEDVVAAFQAEQPELQPLNAADLLTQAGVSRADELVTPAGHLRLWPHRHATDGFYAAAWQRPA
ncbi:SAM-dependent methyltransferase [Aquabacterium fontiphilum]|jgi:16S rRNA (cytosine967-C5)-methyltransferase|uniref:RsmB/NOP family class I SAM-dependent RNA methyltransferase n=1 Tax=Aquabacterium fontiphilum TaxID=450365 RepID=UPI001378FFD2|nr:RsmB/NOP family class I SAM-dependent RNA methyltransferase [Aquabacterium fontiphilum]NBD20366.1 SAM-dependent methyltransferase [Aquabacterium fontiphilum]